MKVNIMNNETSQTKVYLYSEKADEQFGHIVMHMKDGTTKKMTVQYDSNADWKDSYKWEDKIVTHTGSPDDILKFTDSDKKRILHQIECQRRDYEEGFRPESPFRFNK
jgi:hypothetical protein